MPMKFSYQMILQNKQAAGDNTENESLRRN